MKTSSMKIGIIGTPQPGDKLVQSGHKGYGISGIFPGASAPDPNLHVFPSAESLLSVSDVLFIARDASFPYEIAKVAVKESKHLYVESPFSLEPGEMEELFVLCEESRSVLFLDQPLLHHPLYEHYRKALHPGQVVLRVDSARRYRSLAAMQDLWFDLSALLCDVIPSGIRRSSVHIVNDRKDDRVPAAYEVRIDFDNGAQAQVLVNHLTEDESFGAEFFQEDGRYEMGFHSGKARHFKASTGRTSRLKRTAPSWQDLTHYAFERWITAIRESRIPLTINEQGQAVYQLTGELLHKIHSKKQLFA